VADGNGTLDAAYRPGRQTYLRLAMLTRRLRRPPTTEFTPIFALMWLNRRTLKGLRCGAYISSPRLPRKWSPASVVLTPTGESPWVLRDAWRKTGLLRDSRRESLRRGAASRRSGSAGCKTGARPNHRCGR